VERRADLDSFRRNPVGGFLGGAGWIHFCAHSELWGVVLFGRPDRDAAEQMTRSFTVEIADEAAPHRAFVDAQQVDGVDPGAFAVLQRFARDNLARTASKVRAMALVPPAGLPGAAVAGFYPLLESPVAVQIFDTRRDALAWADAATLADALDAAVAELRGAPPLVGALRALLRAQLAAPNLPRICRELAVAERTLQRRLRAAGTSFTKELLTARLAEAQQRLVDGDDPVTVVALDLGFASPQHFSRHFRRVTGETPSEWRERRRTR
jgi:AraC-like DNA-binding protein